MKLNDNKIEMPKEVIYIINKIKNNGFEAFIVGGCVRDTLLKKLPNDWDITSNAKPEQIKKIFQGLKVIPTGIKHGTVTVIINNTFYEVTTYRIDGKYKDGRHPEGVIFTSELKEDLSRRDFTINAMAYNSEVGLVDYFKGVDDLKKGIIKTVGDPYIRFSEDALRIMRAVRFSAQLDFIIDESTRSAIKKLSYKIKYISMERIREEFNKILLSNSRYINELVNLNIINYFMPELDDIDFSIKFTEQVSNILHLKLTSLLYETKEYLPILKRLKYDNKTIERVSILIENSHSLKNNQKEIKKLLRKIGKDSFEDLLIIRRALIISKGYNVDCTESIEIKEIESKFKEIINNRECYDIKDLKISGKEIKDMGFEGKEIGGALELLLDLVMEDNSMNHNLKLRNAIISIKNNYR